MKNQCQISHRKEIKMIKYLFLMRKGNNLVLSFYLAPVMRGKKMIPVPIADFSISIPSTR